MLNATEEELMSIEIDHHRSMGEALNRLRSNADFQLLIEEGYMKDKALASVSLLAVPQIKDQGKRGDVMEDLVAISNLKYFFAQVDNFYEGVTNPILSDEEEAEMAAEEAADNGYGVQ